MIRWKLFIRIALFLFLALSLLAWWIGYIWTADVYYQGTARAWWFGTGEGNIGVGTNTYPRDITPFRPRLRPLGLHLNFDSASGLPHTFESAFPLFLVLSDAKHCTVFVPWWPLAGLDGLILLLIWCKTKSTAKLRGFDVAITEPTPETARSETRNAK